MPVGFNGANRGAAPDLAINGAESFELSFADPVRNVGLMVSTGLSNLPGEVDHSGAVFQISTDTGAFGTLQLTDGGKGYSAWITIRASNHSRA